MNDVMGIIFTGHWDARLRDLSVLRAVAALPVIGRYRVIDFTMSSFVNSGIRNVGVIMQRNYRSLMDHLGSGKEWDLHRKNNGLFLLPPFLTRENVGVYPGLIDALRSNASYLSRSKQEYVILSDSTTLYNINFSDMLGTHLSSHADVTVLFSQDPSLMRSEHGTYFALDADGYVTDMEIDPIQPTFHNTSMWVILLKRELLQKLVGDAGSHGYHDMDRDIFQRLINSGDLRVKGFEYRGMAWQIDSIQSYFKMNMDFLNPNMRKCFFTDDLPIYTKIRDEMPTMYGKNGQSVNSLVADGCVINGKVENSVLFRGVHISEEAYVKNCIIMQDGHIYSNAYIENCILDKQVVIKRNAKLIAPQSYPIVISKNSII